MKTKEFLKNKYKYIILAIFLSIFIVIAKDVFQKELFNFDKVIYDFFVSIRNPILNMFFMIITELGSAEFLIIFTLISVVIIKNKVYRFLIPINLAFTGLFNYILKNFFERPRPNILRLVEENGYSFPSGHAMASTAFYGLLIIFFLKNIKDKKNRNIICIILSLLIIFIDISRIYVGVHYVSDVLAGTCLSISYLIILSIVLKDLLNKKYDNENKKEKQTLSEEEKIENKN